MPATDQLPMTSEKMSVCLLPKMVLHRPCIAPVAAPRPGVAKKALDKGEHTPTGQIPSLQITWMYMQGRNESIQLVPERENLLS